MTSNLIQNYINSNKQPEAQTKLQHTTAQNIRPEKPTGKLIKENIFQSSVSNIKDYGDTAKFMYNAAIKGEGKDYTVGRINDLTLKLGSLAIAGVLSVSKTSPVTKGMEFVGLGTWLAGMALWPKIMGAPIKWLKGVDINQKYQNSEGDKKRFFLDSQYLPWDLYSDEEINKIGDKLKISKNIDGRRDAIQNKMKQIGIQSNTLAMLTAGFTTPIIASLLSDKIQKYVLTPATEIYRVSKTDAKLAEFNKNIEAVVSYIEDSPKTNANTPNIITILHSDGTFTKPSNILTANGNNIYINDHEIRDLSQDYIENLNQKFQSLFNKDIPALEELSEIIGEEDIETLTEKEKNELREFFEKRFVGTDLHESILKYIDGKSSYKDGNTFLVDDAKIDFNALNDRLKSKDKEKVVKKLTESGLDAEKILKLLPENGLLDSGDKECLLIEIRKAVIDEIENGKNSENLNPYEEAKKIGLYFDSLFEEHAEYKVKSKEIKELFNISDGFVKLKAEIKKFEETTIKNVADSKTANQWGEIPIKYLKAIGVSKEEIKELATDRIKIHELLAKHFQEMSNEDAQTAINKMAKIAGTAISGEETALKKLLQSLLNVKKLSFTIAKINHFDDLAEHIKDKSNLYANKLKLKVMDTKSSFLRPIEALDIFRRDIKNEFIDLTKNNPYLISRGGNYDIARPKHPEKFNKAIIEYVNSLINPETTNLSYETTFALNNKNTKEFADDIANQVKKVIETDKNANKDLDKVITDLIEEKHSKKFAGEIEGFVRNIVITNNDVDNWINKFENQIGSTHKVIRERGLLENIVNLIFGKVHNLDINSETKPNNLISRIKASFAKRLNQYQKTDRNNLFSSILENIANKFKPTEITKISEMIKEHNEAIKGIILKLDRGDDEIFTFLRHDVYNSTSEVPFKFLATLSGKDVTNFFVDAAQKVEGKAKYMKFVGALGAGVIGLSAITIARMGRKNNVNPDVYKYKGGQDGSK